MFRRVGAGSRKESSLGEKKARTGAEQKGLRREETQRGNQALPFR